MAEHYTDNRADAARPSDDGRRTGPARRANAVRSGRATGPLTAIVVLIVLALAVIGLWSASTPDTASTTAPGAAVTDQVAPPSATVEPAPDQPALGVPGGATPATPESAPVAPAAQPAINE